jgi:hypothetical protein
MVLEGKREAAAYKLISDLSCLELPDEGCVCPAGPLGLLEALVNGSDSEGRYFANPRLLAGLFWWGMPSDEVVRSWRDELAEQGEIRILPIGRSEYTGNIVDVVQVSRRRRFERFKLRVPIPQHLREIVFQRDGWACLSCGSEEFLSIDHIIPFSMGGEDTEENFQTLCRSCNSKKGATVFDFRAEKEYA